MLNKVWGYLAGLGVLLAGILAAWGIARRSGANDEKQATTERSLEQSKESNEIDTEVHNLPQSELDKRLQSSQRD